MYIHRYDYSVHDVFPLSTSNSKEFLARAHLAGGSSFVCAQEIGRPQQTAGGVFDMKPLTLNLGIHIFQDSFSFI